MGNTLKIGCVRVPYSVIKRNVKYPRLEFRTGFLTVILPQSCVSAESGSTSVGDERPLLDRHKAWILRKYKYIQEAMRRSSGLKLVKKRTRAAFRRMIKKSVRKYSRKFGVKASGISFKLMNSKWAHASARGRLTFNVMMRYLPRRIIDYIACHEVAHLKVFKHDSDFWKVVMSQFPNPAPFEEELLACWFVIQRAKSTSWRKNSS